MRSTLLFLSLLLAACPSGTDDDDATSDDDDATSDDDDATGDDDDATGDDDDSAGDDDDATGDDDDATGDDDDATGDDDDSVDVFAGGAPGEGEFQWDGPPTINPAACFGQGPAVGNGYMIDDVNAVAQTYTLRPTAQDVTPCTYELNGAFTCGPMLVDYDLAIYNMVGIVTLSYTHTGTFGSRPMSFNGEPYTFPPSWAFDIVSTYSGSCTGSTSDCNMAASLGFGWNGFPCTTVITAGTFSFDDPALILP